MDACQRCNTPDNAHAAVMALPSLRVRLIAAAAIVIVLLAWFLHWRSPEVQAPRTFTLLQEAIADGSAVKVLDLVDPRYDIAAQWPNLPWSDFGTGEARETAQRALTALFFMQRENRLSLAVDIISITPGADDRVTVIATLQLSSQQGTLPFSLGPLHKHRFVLMRAGWTGHVRFIDHDPIAFSR